MSDIRREVGHEPSDVSVRGVLWFGAGLIALAVVVHLVLAWMFAGLERREEARKASTFPLAAEQGPVQPLAPPLEGFERKRTTGQSSEPGEYGWVEGQADTVHVPVERAMERML